MQLFPAFDILDGAFIILHLHFLRWVQVFCIRRLPPLQNPCVVCPLDSSMPIKPPVSLFQQDFYFSFRLVNPIFHNFDFFWRWIISWASCEWLCQLIGGGALTSGDRTLSCTSATNDQVFEKKTFPGQRTEEIQLFCYFIAWAFSSFLFYFYLKMQRQVLMVLMGVKDTLTIRNKDIYWCAECLK